MAFLGSIGKFFSKGPGALIFPPAAITLKVADIAQRGLKGGTRSLLPLGAGAVGAYIGGPVGAILGASLAGHTLGVPKAPIPSAIPQAPTTIVNVGGSYQSGYVPGFANDQPFTGGSPWLTGTTSHGITPLQRAILSTDQEVS
jgi:hypothetical protein